MTIKLHTILNLLLIAVISSIIGFGWSFRFTRNLNSSIAISIIFATIVCVLSYYVFALVTLSKEQKVLSTKQLSQFINLMLINSNVCVKNVFARMLKDCNDFTYKNNKLYFLDHEVVIYKNTEILTRTDLFLILSKAKNKVCIICANKAKDLPSIENVRIFTLSDLISTYHVNLDTTHFSRQYVPSATPKLFPLILQSFNRKNIKKYLGVVVVLVISSFFTRISIFYLIVASILLIICVYSFCNHKYNT